MKTVRLRASELGFSYNDCPRCFYLMSVDKIERPSKGFPQTFNKIERQLREYITDRKLSTLGDNFPKGKIIQSNVKMESDYIQYPKLGYQQYIAGTVDNLMYMDDGTFGIVQFKMSEVSKKIELYERQLNAYAWTLEHPSHEAKRKIDNRISTVGILSINCFDNMTFDKDNVAHLEGNLSWQELRYDPAEFENFLREIANLLSSSHAPLFNEECPFCKRDQTLLLRYGFDVK